MIPKIDGARRIRYKNDEMYLMLHRHAIQIFSDILISNEKPNDSLVIVSGGNGYKYDVCATSDGLDEPDFTMKAVFIEKDRFPYVRKIRKSYQLPFILVVMSDMILNKSDIIEDDNLIYFKNVQMTTKNLIDYLDVSTTANDYLRLLALLSILKKGIYDYAEVVNNVYSETQHFANWGEGEEGADILNIFFKNNEPQPDSMIIIHNRASYINRAIKNPYWQDVPYIKLIADNRDFPE